VRFSDIVEAAVVEDAELMKTQHTPNPDAQFPDFVPPLSLHSEVV
jgi:hypothetical protein